MTHFSQNGAIKILVFQHFFCKPIDRFLLALDSLVLSLNDCQQVSLVAFREFLSHD